MACDLKDKKAFISDMDGVVYHGNRLLPGAAEMVEWWRRNDKKHLFLTNSSERSPRELQAKLKRLNIDMDASHFFTSALATATFLRNQKPDASVYVIGEPGLVHALYEAGMTMNDVNPDYVVVGDTRGYNFEKIERAINMVIGGARLIGTNPDVSGPVESGLAPSTGALVSPIELATGRKAFFVGKPNPLMMRGALKFLGCRREDTVIIGDRMDTDIIAGVEAEIDTVLVLSGVTSVDMLPQFPYQPRYIFSGLDELEKALNAE